MTPPPFLECDDEHPHQGERLEKRRRLTEPDVRVVVGGQEFRHYSHILCFASDYFDAAFSSGTNEAKELLFEFPDKNPDEWQLFVTFLEPFSSAEITKENVEMLIPWFHEFKVAVLLKNCDEVYQKKVLPDNGPFGVSQQQLVGNLDNLLNAMSFCGKFGLEKTKSSLIHTITTDYFERNPEILVANNSEGINRIISLLHRDEFRDPLWECMKKYLPTALQNADPKFLVTNELFVHLLHAGIDKHAKRNHESERLRRELDHKQALIDCLVASAVDFPRRLQCSLPSKRSLKNPNDVISTYASRRLECVMRSDSAWRQFVTDVPPSLVRSSSTTSSGVPRTTKRQAPPKK